MKQSGRQNYFSNIVFLDKVPFFTAELRRIRNFTVTCHMKKRNMRDVITFTKLYCDSGQAVHRAVESAFFPVDTCKDRQCMYNVILRRFRATIFAAENDKYYIFWGCVCSLRYPACDAHALCCLLLPGRQYNIFPHYLINCAIFEKKTLLFMKCVSRFPQQIFLSDTFLILTRIGRDKIKYVPWSSCKVCYSCQILKKLGFSKWIFEKYSIVKF
jgi:hypothetical protein